MSNFKQNPKRLFNSLFSCVLAASLIFCSVSCKNYFLIRNFPEDDIAEIENSHNIKEPVIVHWYNSTYNLQQVTFDSTFVSGILSLSENKYDYKFQSYLSNRVYKKSERDNINTIHIYLRYSYLQPAPGRIEIDIKDIDKIEIIEKDISRTTKSHLLGWAGITVLVAIIVATAINPTVGSISFPSIGF